MYVSEPRGSDPYGNEPRSSDKYESGPPSAGPATGRARAGTPTELRDQASRLIEARDPEAALRAAVLYLVEADRIFAEAAYQFSEARRMADQAIMDHSQMDVDRKRLDRELREVEQERLDLEARTRELRQALDGLNAREAALQALDNELAAQKKGPRQRAEDASIDTLPDGGPLHLRPNPRQARTEAEFMQCMTAFKVWSGNRSLRQISELSGGRISPSSVRNILIGNTMPDRLGAVDAIVQGCGGSDNDRAAFASAWRRLYIGSMDTTVIDAAHDA